MTFSERLKTTMKEMNLNQSQMCGLTGKSKASISQYLSGKQEPTERAKRDIALALGLPEGYFLPDQVIRKQKVERLKPEEAASIMGVSKETIRNGLQQGVFPWGYAIKTSGRWTYFINAKKFAEIEGVDASA